MSLEKQTIIDLAKKRGLDIAEETAQNVGALALDIVGEIIKQTPNTIDDLAWAALEKQAREQLAKLIDKIDGEKDVE